jgi:serine/threonine-protein kinase
VSEVPRPLLGLRPDAPPALANAITRALAKKPEDRWPDAAAFRDALSGAAPAPPYEDRSRAPREEFRQSRPAAPQPPPWEPPSHFPPQPSPRGPAAEGPPARPSWMPPRDPSAPPLNLPALRSPQGESVDNMPPMPAMPTWGSRADWREWRRAQKAWERERTRRGQALARRSDRHGLEADATRPVEERLARVRRKAIGAVTTIVGTAGINLATSPHFLWFLIPSAFATVGVLSSVANLWSDGVPLSRIFSRGDPNALPSRAQGTEREAGDPALALATPDVLAGPYGDAVRRAAHDQRAAREILAKLSPGERELIPDVAPTVDALAERVSALALTLHRLDADVGGASLPALERRLEALRAEAGDTPTPEQERRMALLSRQRGSIAELSARRGTLAGQLESAGLALQNLRLDLLKLRSSGFGGAMSPDASATQEARALSRDIANAVDAVREANQL